MYPVLFEIAGFRVYAYGLLLAAAYLLGLQLAVRRARAQGLDANRVMDLGIWVIVSALIGAKLLLFVVDFDQFRRNPAEMLSLVRSAGVFYGGLVVAVPVALLYARRAGLPLWTTADAFAPGIALGHVVGRLGCLMAGCCWGRRTEVPWAITFTNPEAQQAGTPLGVALHPTQLYEAGAELLVLVFLLATERRGRQFPGRTFWGYILLYAISRFVIEFYRGDPRGMIAGLSTSQFISLLLVPLSLVMLAWLARRAPAPGPKASKRKLAA